MKKLFASLIIAAFSLAANAAGGYTYPANELAAELQGEPTWVNGKADGYIWGLADLLIFQERICVRNGTTRRQLSDTVERFIRVNQDMRGTDSVLVISVALIKAYPCQSKGTSS